MFCQKCGKENPDDTKFCAGCGTNIEIVATVKHLNPGASAVADPMTLGKSISTCLSKFFDFNGRASRPEYWWFYLFSVLLAWGAMLVDSSHVVAWLLNLVFFFPYLSAGASKVA